MVLLILLRGTQHNYFSQLVQADTTSPTVETAVTSVTSTGATLTVTANEVGKVYYIVHPIDDANPPADAAAVKVGATNAGGTDYQTANADLVISPPFGMSAN